VADCAYCGAQLIYDYTIGAWYDEKASCRCYQAPSAFTGLRGQHHPVRLVS